MHLTKFHSIASIKSHFCNCTVLWKINSKQCYKLIIFFNSSLLITFSPVARILVCNSSNKPLWVLSFFRTTRLVYISVAAIITAHSWRGKRRLLSIAPKHATRTESLPFASGKRVWKILCIPQKVIYTAVNNAESEILFSLSRVCVAGCLPHPQGEKERFKEGL